MHYTWLDTRHGRLLVAAAKSGLRYVLFEGARGIGEIEAFLETHWWESPRHLDEATRQLRGWISGRRTSFNIPLAPAGTPFQQCVWSALVDIPFGQTVAYGEVARRIGSPRAARAVGAAVSRNPLSIIIPCHRVVASDGRLTGFGGGLHHKAWLLRHEGHAFDSEPASVATKVETHPTAHRRSAPA